MRIGFLGIQCDSANLGLAALAYSAVALADRAAPGPGEIVLFSVNSRAELDRMAAETGVVDKTLRAVPFRHKQPRAMWRSFREIRSCDVVIDFTGGDSFSDIYGLRRLLRKLLHKQLVLWARTPLVLGPQTYGPLASRRARPWFRHVVDAAALVFSRDDLSVDFLRELTHREVHATTDVAVTLPWDVERHPVPVGTAERVGLNVSGLLWAGGYTGDNQFSLATDYREWCVRVVDGLLAAGHEIHLVPHVLARSGEDAVEDDVSAARELQALRPACRLAPAFTSPVDAKSWISGLDAFVGSRMHATIAAFTSGVPTVPAAYSRKFAGFFGHVGYPVRVDLTTEGTDEAVAQTLDLVARRDELLQQAGPARARAAGLADAFSSELQTCLRAL